MSGDRRWSRGGGRDSPSSLHRGLPFSNEEAITDEDSQASTSATGYSRPVAIQRNRASQSSQFLSSSVGHRLPARSFAHSTSGTTEPLHYSSQGVREQTQQLASWGLEQSSTLPRSASASILAGRRLSDHDLRSRKHASSIFSETETEPRESLDSSLPEVIREVSEPVSPDGEESASKGRPRPIVPDASYFNASREDYGTGDVQDVSGSVPNVAVEDTDDGAADEHTALLRKRPMPSTGFNRVYKDPSEVEQQLPHKKSARNLARDYTASVWRIVTHPKTWSPRAVGRGAASGGMAVATALPAVFLGWLLNVLDALSYGTILFPLGEAIFQDTAPDGIAMFFVSTIIGQLVYSSRSKFRGGVGSEMIEVVPFFHKMTYLIMGVMQGADPKAITATVYISYCISSIITGIIFLLLGLFKLGNLVSFFPRSILTGCIGGVGVFLFVTGIEVSAGLSGNLDFSLATLQKLVALDTLPLWTVPLLLAIVLFVLQTYSARPWILPAYFISIVAVFYIVVAATPNLTLPDLRDRGWVFEKPQSGVAFYHFYSYYNLKIVDWTAVVECIPTMLALSFFGIIHVPINVPALALAVQEDDINTNQELVNHGISNTLSGFAGSIQNYLVYANSQMFIRNGGDSRLAGFLLAAATLATWMAGPEAIGYIPIMIVGCLIYLLGIDLVKEAVVDTFGQLHKLEYLMVLVITLVMGFYDFVVGIFLGIIISSLIFVLQTAQVSAVRAVYSGSVAESTVRRHPIHRSFLHEVGSQLCVFKLAGFLFFGTIVDVENKVRGLLDEDQFHKEPIRFLIFDMRYVSGVDFSAAEAFSRIRRLLHHRHVAMILSGISMSGDLGKSLANVGLFVEKEDDGDVPPQVFEDLNKALESCENDQLLTFKARSELMHLQLGRSALPVPAAANSHNTAAADSKANPLDTSTASPRGNFLQQAVTSTLSREDVMPPPKWSNLSQPLLLILQTFRNLSDKDLDFWHRASKYFKRVPLPRGHILYSAGDEPNGFYLLEEGVLTCTYELEQGSYQESVVAGTTCGELPFFSGTERSATVIADTEGVAWVLDRESWEKLGSEWVEGKCELLEIGLRLTSERMNAVTSYVLVNAS